MKQEVGNDATAFDGMWCRVNETEIDLGSMTFETNKYLMSGRMETGNMAASTHSGSIMTTMLALLCILMPTIYRQI